MRKKVRVLIVEDSMMFREMLKEKLSEDLGIEVVGEASDPYIARDKILQLKPDVMTLDLELPRMNGIDFLKKLIPQYPIPVVIVSCVSEKVFEALKIGAVDFMIKPTKKNQLQTFVSELIVKIKIASTAKLGHLKNNNVRINSINDRNKNSRVIVIGASTGGTEAIEVLLKAMPKDSPPIVVVQHMPEIFTKMYSDRLNNCCAIDVKEAEDGDYIVGGKALIAPGSYHMIIKKSGFNYKVRCFKGDKVNGHCPSVDVLFYSAAEILKNKALGIILTGMGMDGAKGLLEMKKQGAITMGQDEKSSVVYGMPKAAYDIGAVDIQTSLENMPGILFDILNGKRLT